MQEGYGEEIWDENTSSWIASADIASDEKPSDAALALKRVEETKALHATNEQAAKENRDDRRVPAARECHKECNVDDKTYIACKKACIERKIEGPKTKPTSKSRGLFARFTGRGGRKRRTRKRSLAKKRTRRRRLPKKRHHAKTRRRR
jgi:hypothetical protein